MNCRCRKRIEMRPRLKDCRIVEVNANQSWKYSLLHRVYSCPDTYEDALGATVLMLTNAAGKRVLLEISDVVKLAPDDRSQLDALAQPFRARLDKYEAAIAAELPQILQPGVAHRFYFLSEEPWPNWLQTLTMPNQCPNLEWTAILSICTEPDRFFEWPQVGELLWPGCTRENEEQRHNYSDELTRRLARLGLPPDPRSNGPAILAFLAAGGKRPTWGSEGWPIHHIYDGTGAVNDGPQNILHAVRDGQHFTHSAGLVAAHPIAHHLAHQSPLLKWLLRREAFLRFGYDPMGVFNP
jgi:hypothetical protein